MGWEFEEMLKITGVILCIAGSIGYGMMKITGWNRAVKELEEWILLFENMKSHISYRRDIIAEVFCRMEEDIYGIGGKYMAAVGRELLNDRSISLIQAWREQMPAWKKMSMLSVEVKNCILSFPEYIGEQECEQQIQRLDFFLHKLYVEKEKMEKELMTKKKPVMAISMAGGITISVLLL